MGDTMDQAQLYELEERERQIRHARRAHLAPGRLTCEDCDTPIPEARRIAIPGVTLCVHCQNLLELKTRHYRRPA
ncbi:TraR/DksA family transcriptional regulator [[Enterobacter] lignolyticus]|uniref:TraR/DksA family transcriptional regulator n=1 Tax=[Enterobacter] lignolyticus TaxID=1334193 RepID=UPI00090054A5|nr:TraR/DksA family transcriptional regulator [[Enterobacter] lignolyticus]